MGCAGRARSLGIWPPGVEIPSDLARGGGEIPGTPVVGFTLAKQE